LEALVSSMREGCLAETPETSSRGGILGKP
jgi:hypothetical protein